MPKRPAAKIDPELQRQLESTAADSGPLEAVLYLRPPEGEAAVQPDRVEALAREILDRASAAAGEPRGTTTFSAISGCSWWSRGGPFCGSCSSSLKSPRRLLTGRVDCAAPFAGLFSFLRALPSLDTLKESVFPPHSPVV